VANVLKLAFIPKACAIELILRPAVEEQELVAIPSVIDDQRIRTPEPLPLPVEDVTNKFVHVLLAIGRLILGHEKPNFMPCPKAKDAVIYRSIPNPEKLAKIVSRINRSTGKWIIRNNHIRLHPRGQQPVGFTKASFGRLEPVDRFIRTEPQSRSNIGPRGVVPAKHRDRRLGQGIHSRA
jgi:hypothetical protein